MVSLILISSFLALAVLGRSFVQYKRNGDFGIRAASINAPLIEIVPGAIFVVTFCFAFGLVLFGYLGRAPLLFVPSIPFQLLGSLIGACGIAVTLLSQIQMGDSWRIGVDQQETTALITHGIYAKSRNPIYLGIFLFWAGVCITDTYLSFHALSFDA
mgnify:CR=1 FL=1